MLVYDPATNPLNNNEWAFPLTECIHIAAMAFSIGLIALVDLRLLGMGLLKQTAAQLTRNTDVWTLAGLVAVITSGLVIFSSDPVHYLHNGPFQFKIGVLLLGIVFHYAAHRPVALSGRTGLLAGLTAGVSLAIWLSLVFAGIFIAFV